ncbi:MAG: iron-containing alcohol dehydrogenase, partial [Rectinema sp.]|nr:iron-containing alcohol dehydrogenase [Rectinema sp.]
MRNFEWATPTRVIFGSGSIDRLGREAAGFGHRALLVYGRESIKKSGLYDLICAQLSQTGIVWMDHGGVQPNPRLAHAVEGARKAREFNADFIIAAGG